MPLKRKRSSSQLNKLEGGTYSFNRLTYPADGLATDKIPNYMIFYINIPNSAQYSNAKKLNVESRSDQLSSVTRKSLKLNEGKFVDVAVAGAALETTKSLLKGNDLGEATGEGITKGAGLGAANALVNQVNKKPKYNRIEKAIALYMPDTLVQTYSHDYDAISIRDALGTLGLLQRGGTGAIDTVNKAVSGGGFEAFKKPEPGVTEVLGTLAEQTGLVGGGFKDLILRSSGKAINPQIEMVYKQTRNRNFIFAFRFQPRNRQESTNIKNIIREFKRYAAPSLSGGDNQNGAYFTIPAQFDIQFMFRDKENPFIARISTCVLENIDVDYASSAPFATFEDGSPTEIGLQLRFTEVDTLTKEIFEDSSGGVNTSFSDGPSF